MRRASSLLWLLTAAPAVWALGGEPAPGSTRTAWRTATVERGSLVVTVSATGTTEPEEVVDVGARVPGIIQAFGPDPRTPGKTIDFGSPVEAGALLARLDPAAYRGRVDLARADLQRADAADVRQSRPVCLLGRTVARALFGDQSPIGAQISLGALHLRVIGVLHPRGSNSLGFDQDDTVLVPWTTVKYRLNAGPTAETKSETNRLYPGWALNLSSAREDRPADASPPASSIAAAQILVRAESPDELAEARRQVTDVLRERHRIPAEQPNDFHLTEVAGPAAPR